MKRLLLILTAICTLACAYGGVRTQLTAPDLAAIARESTDPASPRYYPALLAKFMANDTVMTDEDYQYFYYGTFFQEDYDPYRSQGNADVQAELAPLYNKGKWTRAERSRIAQYASECLADNPVNLRQLTNRIFVYEQNGKYDLAKIWQHKLNHLLLVIASSGTGADEQHAWTVVYPQDEYDFLNLKGITVKEAQYREPYFDYIIVHPKGDASPKGYWFNLHELLRQYYRKHPSLQ